MQEYKIQYGAFVHSICWHHAHGVHPRHPPRTFPLWLLAPRCLGLALFLALPHCGAGARAPVCLGGGRNPPPSFGLILVPSDSALAQPPFSFSYRAFMVSLPLPNSVLQKNGGAHPRAWTP